MDALSSHSLPHSLGRFTPTSSSRCGSKIMSFRSIVQSLQVLLFALHCGPSLNTPLSHTYHILLKLTFWCCSPKWTETYSNSGILTYASMCPQCRAHNICSINFSVSSMLYVGKEPLHLSEYKHSKMFFKCWKTYDQSGCK